MEFFNKNLNNYEATCKKIDKNNMYIDERNTLQFNAGLAAPNDFMYENEYQTLKQDY